MLKKITTWFIAVAFIVQTLVQVNPAQAAPISPLNSTISATLSSDSEVYNLVFSDTNKFYQELADALKSNKEVQISTNSKSYADLPPRLKKIFEIDGAEVNFPENKDASCPPFVACAPINSAPIFPDSLSHYAPMTPSVPELIAAPVAAPATINHTALFFLGIIAIGATAGAGLGTFIGGIGAFPGALVGVFVGLVSGVVAEAFTNQDRTVTIKVNASGELIIIIEPTKFIA